MLRGAKIKIFIIIISFGFVVLGINSVLAEDVDQKYYMSIKAPYIWVNGDFDGKIDTVYEIDGIFSMLYKLEESLGGGLVFGATKDIYTCEISYSQSEHNSAAILESLNLSVKISPSSFKNKRVRPYGIVGWGLSKLSIENGATIINPSPPPITIYDTAKYEGTGFHLGFGMTFMISKKIAIDSSVAYYRFSMDEIELFGVDYEPPKDDVLMTNTVVSLGIQYYF